jgi:hypothetical protein
LVYHFVHSIDDLFMSDFGAKKTRAIARAFFAALNVKTTIR